MRRLVVTLGAAMVAAMLAMVPSAAAQGAPEITGCSLASTEGGITVSWNPLGVAVDFYVYRIETNGNAPRYGNTSETSDFIAIEGEANVFVGAFITGIGYTPAVDCGTATGGPGGPGSDPQCSVQSAQGGVRASWDAIEGAVSYVWRLEVANQPNRYNRSVETSTLVPVASGTTASVFVSGVFADGTYTPAIGCGSATGGSGLPDTGPTCSVQSDDRGVLATWSLIDDAARYVYRYSLSTAPGVNRYNRAQGLNDLIEAPFGVSVTVFVSGQRADGSYTGAIPCGSATSGGNGPGGDACTIEYYPNSQVTAIAQWDAEPGATSYTLRAGFNSLFQVGETYHEVLWSVLPSQVPQAVSLTINFSDGTSGQRDCQVLYDTPQPTLPVPAAECTIEFDADGSDATISYVPSAAGVVSYVFFESRANFSTAILRRQVTTSPIRAAINFGASAFYQEVVNGEATELLGCSAVLPPGPN